MGNRHVASLAFEAVDSLDVFSGGYSAELGRATGGVTSAHTERDVQRDIAGADFGSLYNLIPRFYGTVFELLWEHK